MTRTRFTLDDLGDGLSERALVAFLRNLPPESATAAALSPDCGWSRTDMLLARICEGIEQLLWVTASRGTRKSRRPKKPRRIPRPGVKPDEKRIGKGAIPISDFDSWYGGEG